MNDALDPVVIDNATGQILANDDQKQTEEQNSTEADQATVELFGSEDNAQKTTGVIAYFVESYSRNKNTLPIEVWLEQIFSEYPDIWTDAAERHTTALQVIEKIEQNNQIKADLYAHLDTGKSRESWLAKKIEQGASSGGVAEIGTYAQGIDNILEQANRKNWDAVTRKDGGISLNSNLDGFIAEHHHANTFNIDAIAKGSPYRAKVLEPKSGEAYGKNTVDLGIYDGDGKLVRRYQAKYGADSDATAKSFEKGDYRGQRKLVPEGHGDSTSTEVIEIDGVSSKPLSKEAAKELQKQAQLEAEIKQYNWNDANRLSIAKEIGGKALIAAAFSVGFQGTRILGRRAWNALNGKENRPANEDLQEFFEASIKSAANVGVQVAVSGALVVAAKSGWLKILQNTPAGQIANIAYIGLENAKCLYKLAKGELNPLETLDAMGNVTCTAVGGLAGSVKGGVVGFALGGPVGGFVGAVAGGIAGSAVGDVVYKGAKAVAKTAAKVVESAYGGAKAVVKSVLSAVALDLIG